MLGGLVGKHTVGKLLHGRERDVVFRLKGRADLLRDPAQAPRVRKQQVRDAREERGRGLGPRDDEEARVGAQAVERHVPVLLLAQQGPDEVGPLDVEAHPPPQLLGRASGVLPAEPRVAARDPRDHGPEAEELQRRADRLPGETPLHVPDQLVLLPGLEAAEGLAEGHVADDVEGRVVVPAAQVECRLEARWSLLLGPRLGVGVGAASFSKPLHQEVDVALYDRLLVPEDLVAEAVVELPPDQSMVIAGLPQQGGRDARRLVEELGLAELLSLDHRAVVVRVDVPPGVRVSKQELVGPDADDGAVFLHHGEESCRPFAPQHGYHIRETGGTVRQGPGEVPERVQEDVVEASQNVEYQQLQGAAE